MGRVERKSGQPRHPGAFGPIGKRQVVGGQHHAARAEERRRGAPPGGGGKAGIAQGQSIRRDLQKPSAGQVR